MANLVRKNQKVFAANALNNGQFGSLQTGAKVLSSDLDVLQGLSAYQNGWNDAVVSGEQLPSLEEFQALNYINSYQTAYLLQKGIPEWNAETDYHIGDIAREIGGSKIYRSLTNNNTGNALTNAANWKIWDVAVNKFSTPFVQSQITSGTISYSSYATDLIAEGGVDGNLDYITGGSVGDRILIKTFGDPDILIRDNDISGGNISLIDNDTRLLKFAVDTVELIYDGVFWVETNSKTDRANNFFEFYAYLGADQTVSSGVITKLNLNIKAFDAYGNYFNTTLGRWTPPQGLYAVQFGLDAKDAGVTPQGATALLFKNGVFFKSVINPFYDNGSAIIAGNVIVEMNGTDYLELYCNISGGGTLQAAGSLMTYMSGYRLTLS